MEIMDKAIGALDASFWTFKFEQLSVTSPHVTVHDRNYKRVVSVLSANSHTQREQGGIFS